VGRDRRRLPLVADAHVLTEARAEATVLGVTQDGGHPQAGCSASCCASAFADPSRGHRIACIGVRAGDGGWLLDATPDLRWQAHALGRPLRGILLTHAHLGHYTGLLQLGKEAWAARRVPVYAMPGMAAFLRAHQPWASLLDDDHLELRLLREGEPVPLAAGVSVTPVVVPHRGPWSETVALHVRGPVGSAMYLPDIDDLDRWSRDVADVLEQVDTLWLDGTFYDAAELPHRDIAAIPHPLVSDTMERLAALPASLRQRVAFIHLNHSNPLLDPSSEASAEVARRGFRVARRGDRVQL